MESGYLSETMQALETKLKPLRELETALKPLAEINGYLASAVFDKAGKLLVKHNRSEYDFEVNGVSVVKMMEMSAKTANIANLGKFYFIQVNSELGVFFAVWVVECQAIATVLLEPKGNAGLAKLALVKLGETTTSTVV